MLCRVENKFMDTGTMKVDSFGAYRKGLWNSALDY